MKRNPMRPTALLVLLTLLIPAVLFAGGSGETPESAESAPAGVFEEYRQSADDAFIRGLESWDSNERALEYYILATELDPGFAAAWYQRGLMELKLREGSPDGERSLRRAVEADPGMLMARYKLIDLMRWDKDRSAELMEELEYILINVPEDPRALYIRGQMLAEEGQLREALEYYTRARDNAIEEGDIGLGNALTGDLARINVELGRREEAVDLFRDALRREPKNANNAVNLAWLLFQMDRRGEAIEILEQASEDSWDPNYAREELARMYLEIGEFGPAERLARQVIEDEDWRYGARATLGQVQLRRGEYDLAAENLRRVLEEKSWNAWLWSQLGYAELGREDAEAAREAFRTAVDQWQDGIAGVLGLAEVEEQRGNLPAAIRVLEEAVNKSGGNASLRLRLVIVLYQAGDRDSAWDILQDLESEPIELNQEELRYYRAYFDRNPESLELLRSLNEDLTRLDGE
jgi:tetratricopeptide (TPR) repeat protein